MYVVDTSIVLAAVIDGSEATSTWLNSIFTDGEKIAASSFLAVEARQVVRTRNGNEQLLDQYLIRLGILSIDNALMQVAEHLTGPVRAADAIHIASALRVGRRNCVFVTHDRLQATAALAEGLDVRDPVTDDPNGTVAAPP
jgi:predicted nucleic acid-binding protein